MIRILFTALCLTSTTVSGNGQDSDATERETDASTTADGADQALPAARGAELTLKQALDAAHENHLTEAEKEQGWKLLFDGKKIEGWRRYASADAKVDGWTIEEGRLHKPAGVRAGDIMTVDRYENFEFAWEWKLNARGNNGVKYFIIPERGVAVGHEYQMIDDTVAKTADISTASFYLIVPPAADKPIKPMGEWNRSRIRVDGDHVEHWLNGKKVLEYQCGSPEVMARVPQTKFKKFPGFGKKVTGHLLLTDHQDPCWYRNLKVASCRDQIAQLELATRAR